MYGALLFTLALTQPAVDVGGRTGYWEDSFFSESGEWLHSCNNVIEQNDEQPVPPLVRQYSTSKNFNRLCTEPSLADVLYTCPACQVYCQLAKPPNICFNNDGSVNQEGNPRFCAFQLQLINSKVEGRHRFPDLPESNPVSGPADCNPSMHSCSYIQRDCIHYNKSHDDVDNCHIHPAYCAHEDNMWKGQFGSDGADCAQVTVESFHQHFYDIRPWGKAPENEDSEPIERWFICICNHPFENITGGVGLSFQDCRNNLDSVFDSILKMEEYEQCLLVNSDLEKDAQEICADLTPVKLKKATIFAVLLSIAGILGIFVFYYFRGKNGSGYGPSQPTATTALTSETANGHVPLLDRNVCYDPCVETNAIPRIWAKFASEKTNLKKFTAKQILSGELGTPLIEYMNDIENLKFDKILVILRDIAWWINEIHGETTTDGKNWTIFHGGISPKNIAIVESDKKVNAIVVNYEIAQDISNNHSNVNVCTDEDLINTNYLPHEWVELPERNDTRSVLSVDVYGFACIAWKLLSSLNSGSYISSDPFSQNVNRTELANGSLKLNPELIKDLNRSHDSQSQSSLQTSTYQKLVVVIEECWSKQPALRLTGAQLYWRLNEIFNDNII